jgi:hypothetical protein
MSSAERAAVNGESRPDLVGFQAMDDDGAGGAEVPENLRKGPVPEAAE